MICYNLPGLSKRLSRRKSLLDALGTVPQKVTVSMRRNVGVGQESSGRIAICAVRSVF